MPGRPSSLFLIWVPIIFVGCGPRTIEIAAPETSRSDRIKSLPDWSDLGLTLGEVVSTERVDYARLLQNHVPLDRFLYSVSRVGPTTTPQIFPDRNARLAYYLNCYNATVLRSVVELAGSESPPDTVPEDLESRYRFLIDGQLRSPAELGQRALAEGDWRVRLALYDPRCVGPLLARRPFLAEIVDAQLSEMVRMSLRSPRVVFIDHGLGKRLFLWRGIYDIRETLLEEYKARLGVSRAELFDVLLDWADQPGREMLNSAIGYKVAALPEDHRLNDLEPVPIQTRGMGAILRSLGSINFLRP